MRFTFFIPYFMKSEDRHIKHGATINNPVGGLEEPESINIPESVKDNHTTVEQVDESAGDYKPENNPDTDNQGSNYYGLAEDERNEMEENKGSE
jgi:broad specificity polyphosphatase/5'/3'-nucleotidase SurE